MIVTIQRVLNSNVSVDGKIIGSINQGLLLLVGVGKEDSKIDAEILAEKISKFRIFSDADGKMNLSINDINGEVLAISNFTLFANYRKGNRPDFFNSESPDKAKELFDYFVSCISTKVKKVETGEFGADMKISILADGPVTINMDSKILLEKKDK